MAGEQSWTERAGILERRLAAVSREIDGAAKKHIEAVLRVELDDAPVGEFEAARTTVTLLRTRQQELAAAILVAEQRACTEAKDVEGAREQRRQELAAANELSGWDPADFVQALRSFSMSDGGVPGSLSDDCTRLVMLFGRYLARVSSRDARARDARDRLHGILRQMNAGSSVNARAGIQHLCDELESRSVSQGAKLLVGYELQENSQWEHDPVPA